MGVCCGKHNKHSTDNECENFIIDIILKLKIRKFSFSEVSNGFLETFDIEAKVEKNTQYFYFNEEKFEEFLKKFFIDDKEDSNPFIRFHQYLLPTYLEISENDTYELNFYSYSLSLINDHADKIYFLGMLLATLNVQIRTTVNIFKLFFKQYIEFNLIYFTKKIRKAFFDLKKGETLLILEHKIDKSMYYTCEELLNGVYSERNVNAIVKTICDKLESIVLLDRGGRVSYDAINIGETAIELRHLIKLNEVFEWLFNFTELRSYCYKYYSDNLSKSSL
jgi:hypothetical protein